MLYSPDVRGLNLLILILKDLIVLKTFAFNLSNYLPLPINHSLYLICIHLQVEKNELELNEDEGGHLKCVYGKYFIYYLPQSKTNFSKTYIICVSSFVMMCLLFFCLFVCCSCFLPFVAFSLMV